MEGSAAGPGAATPGPGIAQQIAKRVVLQYIAWRSGDDQMLSSIDRALGLSSIHRLRQWPYQDFLPILHQFDTLFEQQGWLTRTR